MLFAVFFPIIFSGVIGSLIGFFLDAGKLTHLWPVVFGIVVAFFATWVNGSKGKLTYPICIGFCAFFAAYWATSTPFTDYGVAGMRTLFAAIIAFLTFSILAILSNRENRNTSKPCDSPWAPRPPRR